MSALDVWRSREDEERVYRTLDNIPRFDPDFVNLEDFAASIQRAIKRVPPGQEERFLTELIYKLKDPIRYYVEDKGCKSVADLLSLLRVRYSPCRGYEELRLELERISMFPRERLIDFVHRVSRLYRQVTVRAKELIGENIERTMKDVERLARSSFIIALPQRISTKVALLNPESLDDAFDLALHTQRREPELAALPRDDTYEYVRSARAPSLNDPQRRWSEWRQPIETSPYGEPLPSYSAYSYPRYRDDYYRDSYVHEPYYHDDYRRELDYRDPLPPRQSTALLTRQGERPLDYERRPSEPQRGSARGRYRNNRQSRYRDPRLYDPRETREREFREYEPREPRTYESRESREYEPREQRRSAKRETPSENRDHLNNQRAHPSNWNEAGGFSSHAPRLPRSPSPRRFSDALSRNPVFHTLPTTTKETTPKRDTYRDNSTGIESRANSTVLDTTEGQTGMPEFLDTEDEDSTILNDDSDEGRGGPFSQEEITILKSLDEDFSYEEKGEASKPQENASPEEMDLETETVGRHEFENFITPWSPMVTEGPYAGQNTEDQLAFLKSLDEPPRYESSSPQKTNQPSEPKKRVSWGVPLHAEALDIPQSTMICPEDETQEKLQQSPPKEISSRSPRPVITKVPDSPEWHEVTIGSSCNPPNFLTITRKSSEYRGDALDAPEYEDKPTLCEVKIVKNTLMPDRDNYVPFISANRILSSQICKTLKSIGLLDETNLLSEKLTKNRVIITHNEERKIFSVVGTASFYHEMRPDEFASALAALRDAVKDENVRSFRVAAHGETLHRFETRTLQTYFKLIFRNIPIKIKHVITSGYRPQTNGSLERTRIVLTEYLKQYLDKYGDWELLLPFVMYSYNTSAHKATKFTRLIFIIYIVFIFFLIVTIYSSFFCVLKLRPFSKCTPYEVVFGQLARDPFTSMSREELLTYPGYVQDLVKRLDEIRTTTRSNLDTRSQSRLKNIYDRKGHFRD